MPLYDFLCAEGHAFERVVKLADFDAPQSCECGAGSKRCVSAPRILRDTIAPLMGMDGKVHDSLASYRKTLRADGNPQGENYIELGTETIKATPRTFDRAKRRDDIKAAVEDVKNGRVAPIPSGPPEQ